MVGKVKKNLKKLLLRGVVIGIGVALLAGCSKDDTGEDVGTGNETEKIYKIGISQTIEHTALDSARMGFERALEEKGYKDKVEIELKNAQSDASVSSTIAKNFVADKKDLLFGIGTDAAQSLYNETKEIPIVITAVTDPVEAGIVKSLEKPETNVTGTSDDIDISIQFKLLKTLIPDAKKVGIIYSTNESNSEVQVRKAKEKAGEFGLEIVEAGITSTNDIAQAVDSIVDEVDVIYVPTDNKIVAAIPLIYSKTIDKGVPIIGSEVGQVENGALATEGIDFEKLGYQSGLIAIRILEGEEPKNIPVEKSKVTEVSLNKETLEKLGIELPEEISERATLIEGKKSE